MPLDDSQVQGILTEIKESPKTEKLGDSTYDMRVALMHHMRLHADIDLPGEQNPFIKDLLSKARPNEDPEVRQHREDNFRQLTVGDFDRILNTLYRIWNPRLFEVNFPEMPRRFGGETLEEYLYESFPVGDGSIYDVFSGVIFRKGLIDANAVVLIMPLAVSLGEGFVQPIPMPFMSDQVLRCGPDYWLFLSKEHSGATDGDGRVLYLVDEVNIWRITELGVADWAADIYYEHDLGYIPLVPLPGDGGGKVQKSYVYSVTQAWDEALNIATDEQATRLRSAYPKEWRYKNSCAACNGTGRDTRKDYVGERAACSVCNGTGDSANKGPAGLLLIDPKIAGRENLSQPFAGYIQPTGIILEVLPKRYADKIKAGYESVNMGYLMGADDSAQAQSGISRQYGRMDLETFMHRVADGNYKALESVVKITADMRYRVQLGSMDRVAEVLPVFVRPNTFDLITASERVAQVAEAKNAGLSPALVGRMELEVIRKEFGEDSYEARKAEALMTLDPLAGMTPDEIALNSVSLREIDRYIHANLKRLLRDQIFENEDFLMLPRREQDARIREAAARELGEVNRGLPTPEPDE